MAQRRYDKVMAFQTDFLLSFAHVFTFGIMKAIEVTKYAYVELPKEFVKYKALFETGHINEAKRGYDGLLARPQTMDNGELYWAILFDRGRSMNRKGIGKELLSGTSGPSRSSKASGPPSKTRPAKSASWEINREFIIAWWTCCTGRGITSPL